MQRTKNSRFLFIYLVRSVSNNAWLHTTANSNKQKDGAQQRKFPLVLAELEAVSR